MEKYEINKYILDFKSRIHDLKSSMNIEKLNNDIKDLEEKTQSANLWDNPKNAQELISKLNSFKEKLDLYNTLKNSLDDILELYSLYDLDEEIKVNLDKEIYDLSGLLDEAEVSVTLNQKYDDASCILELHPGQGGTEALDWTDMLFRMYTNYANKKGFKVKIIDIEKADIGIKSVYLEIKGKYAYGYFKSERGVHRLVRISPFDSNKRRHTTFTSCDVAPLIEDNDQFKISDDEIRVDTFCSSGAGGQGVNTTYSAVRITHLPTNTVVTCQNERSQIKNKEIALNVLKSKLILLELKKKEEEMKKIKGEQMEIGFGSQIRSYVFCPYTMVKDHRTLYETSNIDAVMDGDLDPFIKAYLKMNARDNSED